MRSRHRISAAIVALCLSGATASTAAQAPDEGTVTGFRDAFVGAVRGWDVNAWAELVTDDVVMMAPDGRVIEGRDAFRELWTRSFEGRSGRNPLHVEIREHEILDAVALVRADYGPEGRDPVGQYVWKLVRTDEGRWRLDWWIFTRRQG